MLRKASLAVLVTAGVLALLDACIGKEPVFDSPDEEAGAGSDANIDPDGTTTSSDAAEAPAGPLTVKVTDAFSGTGIAGVTMFATNPDGEVVSAITSDRGDATLPIRKGASITARIDVAGLIPRLVSYADLSPFDALRIHVVPSIKDGVRVGADAVPNDAGAGDQYRLSVCSPRGGYYGVRTDGVTTTAADHYPCRVGSPPQNPLFFYTGEPGSLMAKYSTFALTPAPDGGTKIVQATEWKPTRSQPFTLSAPLPSGYARIAMLYQGRAVFDYEQQIGNATSGTIKGVPFDIPDWERGLLDRRTQGDATAYTGSIVYEKVPLSASPVSDDPAPNLPLLTSVALTGTAAAPMLEFIAEGPMADVTGVEVVLDNRTEVGTPKQTETVQWIVRLSTSVPTSPVALPALPPEFAPSAPLAWTYARVAFIRNESNPSAVALRAIPTWVEPPRASARLLARYVFGLGTKLRVSTYQTPLQ